MMEEVWKSVTDYPNYEVSNYGAVKALPRVVQRVLESGLSEPCILPERLLSPALSSNKKYLVVSLRNELGKKTHKVHRLVAREFVVGYDASLEVLHGDDNGLNNRSDNLRWGTRRENMQEMYDRERQARGSTHGNALLDEEDVIEIVRLRRQGKTMRAVAADFGVSAATVSMIMTGDNWSHITGITKRAAKPRRKIKC